MKVKKIILLLFLASAIALPAWSKKKDDVESKAERVRSFMDSMEKEFLNLEILANSDVIDDQRIRDALDRMDHAAGNILETRYRPELKPSLEKLRGKIHQFNDKTFSKKTRVMQNQLEDIYEMCFRCHQAHAPNM